MANAESRGRHAILDASEWLQHATLATASRASRAETLAPHVLRGFFHFRQGKQAASSREGIHVVANFPTANHSRDAGFRSG